MRDLRFYWIALAVLFAGFFLALRFTPKAGATTEVCFCHNLEHNPITICTDNEGLINGHMGHVEEEKDSLGQCIVPTPTEVATPSGTLAPTQVPEITATPTPVEPTSTPRVEPTGLPEVPFPQPCNGCNIAPQIPAEESKGLLGHPNMGGK